MLGGIVDKALAVIEMTRPPNSLMVALAVVISLGIASGWRFEGLTIAELTLVLVASYSASAVAMIVNDIIDLESDRINSPHRPLPSGRLSLREARAAATILAIAGLAASTLVDMITTAFYIGVVAFATAYNARLKKLGIIGNIVVAALVATPFVYGWAVYGRGLNVSLVFAAMVFTAVLGREVVKGIPDVEGDRAAGVKTVAVLFGERAAAVVASLLYITSIVLSAVPLALRQVNLYTYVPLVTILVIAMLVEIALLWRNPTREFVLSHKRRVLGYMLLGLVAIALSTSELSFINLFST